MMPDAVRKLFSEMRSDGPTTGHLKHDALVMFLIRRMLWIIYHRFISCQMVYVYFRGRLSAVICLLAQLETSPTLIEHVQ